MNLTERLSKIDRDVTPGDWAVAIVSVAVIVGMLTGVIA